MSITPNLFDAAILAVMVIAFALEPMWSKRLKAAIEAGAPLVRLRAFQWECAVLWAACCAVMALWIAFARPWGALYLGEAESWRLFFGALLGAALVWVNFRDRRVLLAYPDVLARYRPKLEPLGYLMPRTAKEVLWWNVMSFTAGITEEIVCRGYLLSLVAHFTGIWVAAPIAAVLFGLGHAYQGREGIIRTAVFGLIATAIVLISGSLLPAMIVHVVIDLISGDLGRRIVTADEAAA